jgi:hypothetical protein
VSLCKTLRDGASSANFFGRGEHSVEDVITFLELVIIVVVVFRVWGQVWKVVVIGWVIPIVSGPLFRVDSTDGWGQTFTQLVED